MDGTEQRPKGWAEPGPRRVGPGFWLAWWGVVAVAGLFRAIHLGGPIRTDEATTFLFLQNRSILDILAVYSPNNHLLHSLLVKLSTSLLGPSEWAIRLPAALAGWALVPSLGHIGRRLFGPLEGLLAAALAGCTAWLVAYSVDARGYSLAVLCLTWAFYQLWLGVERQRRSGLFWAGLLAGLAVASVLSQLWALIGMAAALVLVRGGAGARLGRVGVLAAGALVGGGVWYLPALASHGLGSILVNQHTASVGLAAAGRSLLFQVPEVFGYAWPTYGPGIVVLGLSLVAGLLWLRQGFSRPLVFIVVLGTVSFGLELAQGVRAPARTFMYLVPLIHILWIRAALSLAKGLRPSSTLAWWTLAGMIAAGLLISAQGRLDSLDQAGLTQAREVVKILREKYGLDDTDRVLADVPDEAPLAYYLTRQGLPQGLLLRRGETKGDRIFIVETAKNPLARLVRYWPTIVGQKPRMLLRRDGLKIWLLEPGRELDRSETPG